MKYKVINSLYIDWVDYLAQEGLYGMLYGEKLNKKQYNKARYIWKRLLKLHGYTK